jgi:cellulose synthase/poly-beta-1,6-N-acetylglucosamine synthase-like glycosyltransferase
MSWLLVLTLVLGGFYAGLMLRFSAGFRRLTRSSGAEFTPSHDLPTVSVVIPARNEEARIGSCLRSVLANHDARLLDVIVVDDGSTDRTAEVVRSMLARARRSDVRTLLLSIPPEAAGDKKAALAVGIAAARGEVILTTDADCRVGSRWVARMVSSFGPDTGYVAGPVVYPGRGRGLASLQALEFLGLVAVGAGAIGNGRPILSNGANAGFRRSVFEAVGGFGGRHASGPGDDDILMQRIGYETPWLVTFCAHPDALVSTAPPSGARAFLHQRLRWGATAPRYRHGQILPTLAAVYSFYALLLALALAGPFIPGAGAALALGLALKVCAEAPLIVRAARKFGRTHWLRWFIPAQALHIPYVVFFPAAGTAVGFRWKGRRRRA